jgi:23S rRNA (guanosine2251-2'-O)-methyltransferase
MLLLTGFTPLPPRKEIAKTALGADKTVPWRSFQHAPERWMDTVDAIRVMKEGGWKVLALEITTDPRTLDSLRPDDYPLCLVVGNELTGISPQALAACDGSMEIAMHGVKHSLNVAVAAGIAMYEAVRQQP